MNRTKKLISSFIGVAVLGLGAAAQAQTETTPPPTETPPPPPPAHHSSSSSMGDGAGIGVGAAILLSAPGTIGGGQFVYDVALFHVEGILGFSSAEVNGMGDRGTNWLFGAGG